MAAPDPLDMTLRTFLSRILDAQKPVANDGWVNIRPSPQQVRDGAVLWPWRHILESAEKGECKVSRVGRKLLMRREELDRWLDLHSIKPRRDFQPEPESKTEQACVKQTAHRLLAESGLLRR